MTPEEQLTSLLESMETQLGLKKRIESILQTMNSLSCELQATLPYLLSKYSKHLIPPSYHDEIETIDTQQYYYNLVEGTAFALIDHTEQIKLILQTLESDPDTALKMMENPNDFPPPLPKDLTPTELRDENNSIIS